MQGVIEGREAAARRQGEPEASLPSKYRIRLEDVKGFHWNGEKRPPTFEFSIGEAHYRVALRLDRYTKQPNLYVEEETP
jgi:hypothetical protein